MRKPKWTETAWIKFMLKLIATVTGNVVSISGGNNKMGHVPSVSLPALIYCIMCGCRAKCYANRLEKFRKNIREAYARNAKILKNNPAEYWRQVREAIAKTKFFRFHVSGEIPNYEYFCEMVESSIQNPHCQILCFTKKYAIVNTWIKLHGDSAEALPKNLHILFSAWKGLKMENPYNLPEAHVRYKDGTTTAKEGAIHCFGNCETCYLAGCGCWALKCGEQLELDEH